jgi:GNAT superfamily N-acetyltransferase
MLPADLSLLHTICCDAYSKNFQHHWEAGALAPYLEQVFGIPALEADLDDPDIHYYVSFAGEEPFAFMKLDCHSNLPGQDPATGIELEKLYILPSFQGKGAGKDLLQLAFRLARENSKETFWLAVIDTNKEAIAFYQRWGFRFHSTARVGFRGFREELRGMWRMSIALHPSFPPSV